MFDIKKIVFYKRINETLFLLLIFLNIYFLLPILINLEKLKDLIVLNLKDISNNLFFLIAGVI